MIIIKVELWPHGDEERKEEIASAKLWNDGSGDNEIGNYEYTLYGKKKTEIQGGFLKGFKRLDGHVWDLICGMMLDSRFKRVAKLWKE